MASTYSALKIELIATGEQSGTWGATTNTNLGDAALGEAITGSADVAFSSADVTVTLTDVNTTQTARNLRLNLTGTSGGARNLILGSGCQIEKLYLVNNGLADAVTVKNTTGTGIAVPAGKTMFVYNNGTNVVEAVNSAVTLDATTIDTTNLEVTNIKAKDGTASSTIANSTGVMTVASSVLTTTDINGGTIDGTTIGVSSASTGAFTTLTSNGATTFTAGTASTSTTTGTAVITGGLGVSGRVNAANFDGIVGANTAAAGSFTTINASTSITNAGLTTGRVVTTSTSGLLTDSANLAWDTNTLSIVSPSPSNTPLNLSSSSTSNTLIQLTNTNAAKDLISRFRQNAGGGNFWDLTMEGSTNDFTFEYNDGEKVRITNAGAVLVGATTAVNSSKFLVSGVSSANSPVIQGSSSAGAYLNFFNNAQTTGSVQIGQGFGSGSDNVGILYNNANAAFVFGTNGTERMRIDASGNLGLGVTPSAWGSGITAFQLAKDTSVSSHTTGGNIFINSNTYYNGSNWIYSATRAASQYQQNNGNHVWYIAASGTAGDPITFTQAMTLEASGRLGVGITSPQSQIQVTGSNTYAGAGLLLGSAGVASGYIWTTDNLYIKPNTTAGTASGILHIVNVSDVTKFTFDTLANQAIAVGGIFKANGAPSLSAAAAGEAIFAPEPAYGALIYGRGTNYDAVIGQRTTGLALGVVAATNNIYLGGNIGLGGTTPTTSGTGITFPATQSGSSDANTLDDYEEGTWTPVLTGFTLLGTQVATGTYTKIGRMVYVTVLVSNTDTITSVAGTSRITSLPFTPSVSNSASVTNGNVGTIADLNHGGIVNSSGSQIYTPTFTIASGNSLALNAWYLA